MKKYFLTEKGKELVNTLKKDKEIDGLNAATLNVLITTMRFQKSQNFAEWLDLASAARKYRTKTKWKYLTPEQAVKLIEELERDEYIQSS